MRAVLLALLCGLLQALLPRYTLGTAALAPLSVVLGVAVAGAMSRGRWTVPAALAGVLAADLALGVTLQTALIDAGVLGLQAMLAGWLMRHTDDPDLLQLDTAPRLRRFVLVAAPAAAMVGVLAGMLAQWGLDAAAALPLARPQLAGAVGRFIADTAGIIITAPILLCWLARPQAPWRPRRRLVALPLVLLVAFMLPGFDQVARRDEVRLQTRFDRDADARQLRIRQLLTDPLDAVLAQRGVLAAGGDGLPMPLFDRLAAGWIERVGGLRALGWLERTTSPADNSVGMAVGHAFAPGAGPQTLPGAQASADGRLRMSPALQQAINKALTSETPQALSTVALDGGNKAGSPANGSLLLLQAVPPGSGSGAGTRLVFAVADIGQLLANALPDNDDLNLRLCLTDGSAAPGAKNRRLAGAPGCEADLRANAVRAGAFRLALGEARFDLVITEPSTADNRLFTAVWLLALPAVVGVAMLSALLLAVTGRLNRIEDRVRERTAALQNEINERRQAQSAQLVSEQRFRAIFDSVSIGVTMVDPQGRIVAVNPAFCTMLGYTADALLQRPLDNIRLPDVSEDDGTAAAVGGGQARRQRYLTADGRVLQVAASLRPLFDAGGHPVATVGALQDLTQVLRLREAERERDEAEIANRTKSNFLARLSHELREPLNAIVGFTQMLGRTDPGDRGDADGAQQQQGLAQIRQVGWHLLDMVNDVLDLSRMEAGSLRLTLEPVSLADLAQDAVLMVEPNALRAGVQLDLSLSPQADRVQADPQRLRQVLINLLSHAIQFNRPGGKVLLRTRPDAVGEVLIEVEGTRMDLSEEQLTELFTPFARPGQRAAAAQGSGDQQISGMGLAVSRQLSGLMGGELTAATQGGQGTVFSLRLRHAKGEPQRSAVKYSASLVPSVSIGTVLYVEHEEADIASMETLLAQRPGIKLICVRSAEEGLAMVHDVDLMLLAFEMPNREGAAMLRELQANSRMRSTPVIVVSADGRPDLIDQCFDAGAAQFLTKPLDAQQTLRAIDTCLA